MRLLLGLPGSGKTTLILDELRRRPAGRLLAPTSTMAGHLRNQLAREGAPVRPSSITTIAAFLQELAPAAKLASSVDLVFLIRQILAERQPAAFASLLQSPGFAAALAHSLEDLANSGCGALQWAALRTLGVYSGPAMQALGLIYDDLEGELKRRGLHLRATQMLDAARHIRDNIPPLPEDIYIDGFFSFSRGELELIRALKTLTHLTITLPEWPGATSSLDALRQMGFREQRLHPVRAAPQRVLVASTSRQREVEDIALRILEHRASGLEWRQMGIILRQADPYAPLLETTCARLGIPVRAYFSQPLTGHPVVRTYVHIIDALLGQWECALTAKALAIDSLHDLVRAALPAQGLSSLLRIAPAEFHPRIQALEPLTPWAIETATPAEWAARLASLRAFIPPPAIGGAVTPQDIRTWRAQAEAQRVFESTLREIVPLLGGQPMFLEGFWREAQAALQEASLRLADHRRDTVHLLDVYEARQWELPVVFLCGLLEGDFPHTAQPDPVLSEETRLRLRQNGIPVSTRTDREAEEAFLFDFALTRATRQLVLSYPTHDEKGQPTLRTFALDHHALTPVPPRVIQVRPAQPVQPAPPPSLAAAPPIHDHFRPTALESFLQCPFQFFASHTLKLREPNPLPHERLDILAQGSLIHQAIADHYRGMGSFEETFTRALERLLQRKRVPPSHRVELARVLILRSLALYEQDQRIPEGWETHAEKELELTLDGALIKGRADRVDISPDGKQVAVVDYKFTSNVAARLKKYDEGASIQGGLYLAALCQDGATPAAFHLAGVRNETKWSGSDEPEEVRDWVAKAIAAARDAIARIRQGDITVKPADTDGCQYCAFADACRVKSVAAIAAATEG
ncbi:MAG TPA: PD-(D/E)XK nuclease family protein [Paludibaculum sp.]|jgi:ATP-dependent helicase/DNAse subunit B